MRKRLTGVFAPLFLLLTIIILATGNFSCRSLSSEIAPSDQVSRTLMVEWENDFEADQANDQLSTGLPDGRLLVIARDYGYRYSLQSWSEYLVKEYDVPIGIERDEEDLVLYNFEDRTLLLTQADLDDDVRALYVRDLDTESGIFSAPREILRTDANFEQRFIFSHSPDRSWIFMYGVGERFGGSRREQNGRHYRAVYTALMDMSGGDLTTTRDTLIYPNRSEDHLFRWSAVSNDGVIGIVEVMQTEEDIYECVANRIQDGKSNIHSYLIPNRLDMLDPSIEKQEFLKPSTLSATFMRNGSLVAATILDRDETAHMLTTVRISPDFSSAEFDVPVEFDRTTVEQLSGEEISRLHYTYGVRDVFPGPDESVTLIMDSRGYSSYMSQAVTMSYRQTKYTHGPLIVTNISRSSIPVEHRFIRREEYWKDQDLANFEGGFLRMSSSDSINLVVRNRGVDGVLLYSIRPDADSVSQTLLARLGDAAFIVAGMTVWHNPNELTLFAKGGEYGRDWQILRITR